MNKKIMSVFITLLLFTSFVFIFLNSKMIMETVSFSIDIWINQLVPTLFPFFFLSEFLIHYGFVEILSSIFNLFMGRLFHLKGETSFVLALSMISGFPSGAKYTKSLYEEGIINEIEASHLLTFTHFSNPIFIFGFVASILLQNQIVGIILFFCHYGVNFIIGFIFRSKNKILSKKITIRQGLASMHQKRIHSTKNFGQVLTNSIFHTFHTLVLMLGIITFFLMVSTVIFDIFNLSSLPRTIVSGLLEMTQGVYAVNALSLPLKIKASLIVFFLSFGGLSVHMQVYSIISDTAISYRPFFLARILHAIISSVLVYLLCGVFI